MEKLRAQYGKFLEFLEKAHFEFLEEVEIFELYFENYCIIGKIEGTVEVCLGNFWNFWNKDIHFEFLSLLKRKKKKFEVLELYFGNCVLLEKLRARLKFLELTGPKFEFLSLLERKRKVLKFFEFYFGNCVLLRKIFEIFGIKKPT